MAISDLPEGDLSAAASVPAEGSNEAKPRRVSVTKLAAVLHPLVQPEVVPGPAGLHVGVSEGFLESRAGSVSGQDLVVMLHPMADAVSAPPPPPPEAALTFAAPDTATAGVSFDATITNTGGVASAAWSLNVPSGWTVTPSSGGAISAGATVTVAIVPTAGSQDLVLTSATPVTGNPQSVVVSGAAPTTLTLSGSASGVDGSPTTITGTLNAPATVPVTVTPTPATGATFSTPAVIGVGQTSTTWTVMRATSGTAAIDATTSPSLTVTGGFTYTSAPAGSLPSITLLTAGAGTYPWTAGHAFRPGDVPSGAPLAGLQINVKSTWPDGSAKIALVSGVATATGATHSVALGTGLHINTAWLTLAQLRATGISAVIGTDAYGSATWAADSADWEAPFMVWAEGPVMSSWIFRKPIGSDTHLTAWMEVRFYSTGDVEVVPWIENGYLMVTGPTGKAGTYSFTLGGTSRFSMSMPVYHHTRQPLLSGSTLSYWLGTDKSVALKHDPAYLASTGLTNKWLASLQREQYAMDGVSTENHRVSGQFTPYELHVGPGNASATTLHPSSMGSGGEQPSIGVQPAWEGVYLSGTNTNGVPFRQLLQEGYRFGAYQTHYRDESTNRPIRFSQHVDTGLRSETATNFSYVRGNTTTLTPTISGYITDSSVAQHFRWAVSHHPAGPLLAYVATGRFWFMEECQHIAAANYLAMGTPASTTGGVFDSKDRNDNNLRTTAWNLRSLFIADCVTPDDDALKPDLSASVDANITNYWNKYVSPSATPTPNPYGIVRNNDATYGDSCQAWQHDYFVTAIAKLVAFRVGGTFETRKKAREFFDWTSRSVVGRGGSTGATEFLYRYATTEFPYGETSTASLHPGATGTAAEWDTGTWMPHWGDFYDRKAAGYGGSYPRVDGDLQGNTPEAADTHWGRYLEALAVVASLNATGASAALARIRATTTWAQWALGQSGSVFAWQLPIGTGIDTQTLLQENFADFIPAVGARTNININSASSVDFDTITGQTEGQRWWNGYNGNNSFDGMRWSYSGIVWAPEYGAKGALILNGGGHGNNIGAFSYLFDLESRTWKQVGALRNLPATSAWSGWSDAKSFGTYNVANDLREIGWYDYNHNGSMIAFSDHVYLQNAYVSQAEGGGYGGSLMLPQSTWSQDPSATDPRTSGPAYGYRWAPHLQSMHDGKMARASSAVLGDWSAYAGTLSFKDTVNARLWHFGAQWPYSFYFNLASGVWPQAPTSHAIQKASGGNATLQLKNASVCYVPEAACVLTFYPENDGYPAQHNRIVYTTIYNMASGVPVQMDTITVPTRAFDHNGVFVAVAWCPTLQKFYFYEGYGDTFCHTLTPSTLNFLTCTWTWGRESFTGPTPPSKADMVTPPGDDIDNYGASAPQGNFQWSPAYGCFVMTDGPGPSGTCYDGATRNGLVQLWRPPGTPV